MTFGKRLQAARKRKKLTQKTLAQLINAAHNSISNWEHDLHKPDPDTIQNLCWALDVTPNYFFLDDTEGSETIVDLTVLRGSQDADSGDAQRKQPTPVTEDGQNIIKIAGRDGSYVEKRLTDDQLAAVRAMVDQLPEADF